MSSLLLVPLLQSHHVREGVSLRLIAFLSVLLPLITPNSTFEEVTAEITRKREANEANPSFSSTESSVLLLG